MSDATRRRVLITTYLEPALIEGLRAQLPELEILVPWDLLELPRYDAEHRLPRAESDGAKRTWRELIGSAEILFDFGPAFMHPELGTTTGLRWIQATSAGVGQLVHRIGLDQPGTPIVTTARGVHGRALAEFVVMGLIALNRDLPQTLRDQQARRWVRGSGRLIRDQKVGILGLGSIGREVAGLLGHFGAHTIGIVRSLQGREPAALGVDELHPQSALDELLPRLDCLVLSCPHTPETEGIMDQSRLALLPQSAVLINIARGQVVDEPALIRRLAEQRLRGAVLDVAATEPLPADSPLWSLPNVIISPHSASTVIGENQAIAELFASNLRAYLERRELVNVLDKGRLY
ncbi:MAG: D-2-hydroxyacid dehydrogenase [Candidatus Dormibacteraeota bacterium]|nr:D-2-hydroxyacid dehydrogenase [Candidatus Dormibacteraeota bacterium]